MKKSALQTILFLIIVIFTIQTETSATPNNPNWIPAYFLPIGNDLIGFDIYRINWNENFTSGFIPYVSMAYDLHSKEELYKAGAKFVKDNVIYGLNYGDWLDTRLFYLMIDNYTNEFFHLTADYKFNGSQLIGYGYQKGIEAEIYLVLDDLSLTGDSSGGRAKYEDQGLNIAIFSGETGRKYGHRIETDYLFIGYFKRFLFGSPSHYTDPQDAFIRQKSLSFNLYSTFGETKQAEDSYHSYTLQIPIIYHSLAITTTLGYAKQSPSLTPGYDLDNYLRGEWDEPLGNRLAAINLEYRRYIEKVGVLGLFYDYGGSLTPDQSWESHRKHYSYGINYIVPLQDDNQLQAYAALTDEDHWKLGLALKYTFF